MRKLTALSAFLALFIITGCTEKNVNVEGDSGGTQEIQQPEPAPAPAPAPTPAPSESTTTETETVGSVYFDFDKFNIRADMQSVVDQISEDLNKRGSSQIVIEGNTDEFGTDEYNYALGTKRAISVRDALVVKGINKSSVRVISFGESKPICTEKTKECYQQNRRADVKASQ